MSYHVNDIDMLSVKKTLFFVKRSEKGVIGDYRLVINACRVKKSEHQV